MSKKEKISKPEDRQISQEETIIQKRVDVLSYLVRTYDGLTQLLVKTQNRIHALSGKPNPKHDAMIIEMQSTKGKIARQIEKDLDDYAIWKDWLKNVPGIGPWIGAKLILKYYYKNVPICIDCHGVLVKEDGNFICSACGHDSKGDGTLTFRMDDRDFSNISKWWKFMGRHVVDGAVPKRKANQLSDWSQEGRLVGFHIGESFNKQSEDHLYKAFMLSRKKKQAAKHPEWSKGHVHNAAKNEAIKLFLAHFWIVARMMDDKPVTEPYAGTILGHTGMIDPYYYDEAV